MLHVYICEMRGAQSADSVSYSRARVLLRQLAVGSRNICADQYELVEGALSQPVNYLNVTIGPSVAFGDEFLDNGVRYYWVLFLSVITTIKRLDSTGNAMDCK